MGFGRTADDYERDQAENADAVWIKPFRDPETRVRLLNEPSKGTPQAPTMGSMREHYSKRFKEFFPCDEDHQDFCVGCTDPDPETRKRNRRFITNALDDQGRLQLFKMGPQLHKKLNNKKQRLNTICDRDYIIVKTGKGLDTDYDAEAGEQYAVVFDGPLHDIENVLTAKYAEVAAKYAQAEPTGRDSMVTQSAAPAENAAPVSGRISPQPAAGNRITPQPAGGSHVNGSAPTADAGVGTTNGNSSASGSAPAAAPAASAPAPAAGGDEAQSGGPWSSENKEAAPWDDAKTLAADPIAGSTAVAVAEGEKSPKDMTIKELRVWLADPEREVEYPATAARSRLVKLAEKWLADNADDA